MKGMLSLAHVNSIGSEHRSNYQIRLPVVDLAMTFLHVAYETTDCNLLITPSSASDAIS
jgi:hypothetical protein